MFKTHAVDHLYVMCTLYPPSVFTQTVFSIINMSYQCIDFKNVHADSVDIYIDFISRGNILNNIVNLPYGPQTITIATKHTIYYYE